MSEVLDKYRAELKKAEGIIETWRGAMVTALGTQLVLLQGRGATDTEAQVTQLVERAKGAKDTFQIKNIQKEFLALRKEMQAAFTVEQAPDPGGGLLSGFGGLFGKKKGEQEEGNKPGAFPLIDAAYEALVPYATLLDSFAKGTLTLQEKEEPWAEPLNAKRLEKFRELTEPESIDLGRQVYNFLIHKSNEGKVVSREREELKQVIGSLTKHIQNLAVSSDQFGDRVRDYASKVEAAKTLIEIHEIQKAILAESMEVQKANQSVRQRLSESEQKMIQAAARIAELEKELDQARQAKAIDALTQLFNRGYFDERLAEALAKYRRDKRPTSLIIFDIDHFKKFNDTFGHQVGDKVLQIVARIAKESVRESDTLCRYGGEEFVILLYDTDREQAAKVAEQVRANIHVHEFGLKGKTIHVSVSLGVGQVTDTDTGATLLKRADAALYKAKENGRNRVELAE